jgi:hypothetical protein
MINLPYILNESLFAIQLGSLGKYKCQRNSYFTNYATAQVQNISGSVTFGQAVNGVGSIFPSALQEASPGGVYQGAHGLTACAQLIGYAPFYYEECDAAAMAVDPASLL